MNTLFHNGHERAFGTWPLKKDQLAAAVTAALKVGYRTFDTAQMYGNEADLGEVLASSGIPASDLLVVTKVHPDNYPPEKFMASVEKSLKDLRTSAADVLLLHWPPAGGNIVPSLKLLEEAHRRGLARHIGISNYTSAMMRTAKATVEVPLVINQVEFHPAARSIKTAGRRARNRHSADGLFLDCPRQDFRLPAVLRDCRSPWQDQPDKWPCAGFCRRAWW